MNEALTKVEPTEIIKDENVSVEITPAQAKIQAIADLTHSAYAKASTLELTKEEKEKLQADFPDEAFQSGAAGKENLIYIEHAFLRDRFNDTFGPGQWAIIPRNRWSEEFKTNKGEPAIRVYVEAMLLVRGCFVGEAVGDMAYFPNNSIQNFGDAVEGAKTGAFRRCAKELGVGLQVWKKDFCLGWWKRRTENKTDSQVNQTRKLSTSQEQMIQSLLNGTFLLDSEIVTLKMGEPEQKLELLELLTKKSGLLEDRYTKFTKDRKKEITVIMELKTLKDWSRSYKQRINFLPENFKKEIRETYLEQEKIIKEG